MKRRGIFGQFLNPHKRRICRGLIHFFLWQVGYYNDPFPSEPPPEGFSYPNEKTALDPNQPHVTWINHSTYWIHLENLHFLVDPIWSERCSPVNFIGPKRLHPPPIQLDQLPQIDYVIISHNHYDHLDKKTILELAHLNAKITWVVPKGVKGWFKKCLKAATVLELDWWESRQDGDVCFTAVPAQHFSGRYLWDRNRTLWMGCVVEKGNKRFYFSGDTGYNSFDFKEIGRHFQKMDLSLLPIGTYLPRRFMQDVHVNPEDSVKIHQEVGSRLSVGGHWRTFRLSNERVERPPYDLLLALEKAKLQPTAFRVLSPGESINW